MGSSKLADYCLWLSYNVLLNTAGDSNLANSECDAKDVDEGLEE